MKPEPGPDKAARPAPGDLPMSRREFLLQLALWLGWGSFGLAQIERLSVPAYRPQGRHVALGPAARFAPGVTPLPLYQAWLVRTATGFYALKAVCTHLGCPPAWQPEQQAFVCACHGSRFDASGALVHGPALRALERLAIYSPAPGQLALDLDRSFRRENGGWNSPEAFVSWPQGKGSRQ